MVDGVCEPVHPEAEPQDPWRQTVQLLARQEGNQGFVIGFNLDLCAQDVVDKLFGGPGDRKCLLFNLGVASLRLRH